MNHIADYLIAKKKVSPFLMVMVPPFSLELRLVEYGMNTDFSRFFVEELLFYGLGDSIAA